MHIGIKSVCVRSAGPRSPDSDVMYLLNTKVCAAKRMGRGFVVRSAFDFGAGSQGLHTAALSSWRPSYAGRNQREFRRNCIMPAAMVGACKISAPRQRNHRAPRCLCSHSIGDRIHTRAHINTLPRMFIQHVRVNSMAEHTRTPYIQYTTTRMHTNAHTHTHT